MSNTAAKRQTRKDQVKTERRRRKSFNGLNQKLSISEEHKDPDYVYRWINDSGNRIHETTQMDDWDIVKTSEFSGDSDERNSGLGENIERIVDRQASGLPLKAFLCKKRKEFVQEDRRLQQAQIDETEKAILKGPIPGAEGLQKEHSYIPEQGNSIKSSDQSYKP